MCVQDSLLAVVLTEETETRSGTWMDNHTESNQALLVTSLSRLCSFCLIAMDDLVYLVNLFIMEFITDDLYNLAMSSYKQR